MLTILYMSKDKLITSEKQQEHYLDKTYTVTITEDLECLLENIRLGKQLLCMPYYFDHTYYLPKLTKREMRLVEKKNRSYLATFRFRDPDVGEEEMKLSESSSKFVKGWCRRKTLTFDFDSCFTTFQNK